MQLANGDASSSDSAFSATNRPAMQQFRKQKEQAAVEGIRNSLIPLTLRFQMSILFYFYFIPIYSFKNRLLLNM